MNQSQHENDVIKKMSSLPPQRHSNVKLLCHFDQSLEDSSIYNREPITWGLDTDIGYYTGTDLSAFDYAVATRGNYNDISPRARHSNYIAYDISDVNLSGTFCIDYWFRNVGSYGHWPMFLLPDNIDIKDKSLALNDFSHLANYSDANGGFYTYDPSTDTRQYYKVGRDAKIHHIAVTRDTDNTIRWFKDGVLQVAYSANSFDFTSKYILVSYTYSDSFSARANIDELRIVVGCPCYTTNFTPRTTPYTTLDVR